MVLPEVKETDAITKKILNLSYILLPLAFIIGNFAINFLVLVIIALGLINYKNYIFNFKNKKYLKLIFLFFVLIVFFTLLESINKFNEENILRSLLFFRYFFLMCITILIIEKGDFYVKTFLASCFIFSFLISVDLIIQYFLGYNIIGIVKTESVHISGLFGEEKVAGGYIQRFFLISSLFIGYSLKKNNIFFILIFLIVLTSILVSGNRMPFISSIIFLILAIYFFKEYRIKFGSIVVGLIIVFSLLINYDKNLNGHYQSFSENVKALIPNIKSEIGNKYLELKKTDVSFTNNYHNEITIKKKDYNVLSQGSGHSIFYITAIDIWNDNPLLGQGIRAFRFKCAEKHQLPNRTCGNHPHNFHLEILINVGLFGLLLITYAFILMILDGRNLFQKYKKKIITKDFFYCFVLSLIIEFFIFKSTGSFFSTYNATYIFLLSGLIGGFSRKIKDIP